LSTHYSNMVKEEFAFQRQQQQKRLDRIVQVARGDPNLPLSALAERFGLGREAIARILHEAKVPVRRTAGDDVTYRETVRGARRRRSA
jgi:hypothetical protein